MDTADRHRNGLPSDPRLLWSGRSRRLESVRGDSCPVGIDGQRFGRATRLINPLSKPVVRVRSWVSKVCFAPVGQRQTVPQALRPIRRRERSRKRPIGRLRGWIAMSVVAACGWWFASTAVAQLIDPMDSYPPRWLVAENDCDARVIDHSCRPDGGHDDGPCETMQLRIGDGTTLRLVYPIEPTEPLEDLVATLRLWSDREGVTVGFRVRFPHFLDPINRRPMSVHLRGAEHDGQSRWQKLGIGRIGKSLQRARMSVRQEHGAAIDLDDAYVDGVFLDAYVGVGKMTVRLDDLRVEGMVPMNLADGSAGVDASADQGSADQRSGNQRSGATAGRLRPSLDPGSSNRGSAGAQANSDRDEQLPFPSDRLTRILQHRGEPLAWVRTLGFDAIWLDRACDAAILSEATRAGLGVYCPMPTSIDAGMRPLLDPVRAWVVTPDSVVQTMRDHSASAADTASDLDERHLPQFIEAVKRLRSVPSAWRRPLIAGPVEASGRYARHLDAVIHWLPPPNRGLHPSEEFEETRRVSQSVSGRCQLVLGVPPAVDPATIRQCQSIAASVGMPTSSWWPWHMTHSQTIRNLGAGPQAILFRSDTSLATPDQSVRAAAAGLTNRLVAGLEPALVTIDRSLAAWRPSSVYVSGPTEYFATEVPVSGGRLHLVSAIGRGNRSFGGDGTEVSIPLAAEDSSVLYRLSDFAAASASVERRENRRFGVCLAPDVAEVFLAVTDSRVAGRMGGSLARFRDQAAIHRWTLASAALQQTRADYQLAASIDVLSNPQPSLLAAADATMQSGQTAFDGGDPTSTFRVTRRADAWTLRCRHRLAEAIENLATRQPIWRSVKSSSAASFLADQPSGASDRLNPASLANRSVLSSPPVDADQLDLACVWAAKWQSGPGGVPASNARGGTPIAAGPSGGYRLSPNLLAGGGLNQRRTISPQVWSFGRRMTDEFTHEVRHVVDPSLLGGGAIAASAFARRDSMAKPAGPLNQISTDHRGLGLLASVDARRGGGYGSTVMQIRSADVELADRSVMEASLWIRTVGFEGPDRGVLVYETSAGPSCGRLIRTAGNWRSVRLRRQIVAPEPVALVVELIGSGEVMVDEFAIRRLQADTKPSLRPLLRPLSSASASPDSLRR